MSEQRLRQELRKLRNIILFVNTLLSGNSQLAGIFGYFETVIFLFVLGACYFWTEPWWWVQHYYRRVPLLSKSPNHGSASGWSRPLWATHSLSSHPSHSTPLSAMLTPSQEPDICIRRGLLHRDGWYDKHPLVKDHDDFGILSLHDPWDGRGWSRMAGSLFTSG